MNAVPKVGKPITRTSLAESVYQQVLEAILSGQVSSGTELSEVALAAELGVSRTPVHEALRRLAADGMVELLANRQARVVQFTPQAIRDIYGMRVILECAAAESAARNIDAAELAPLRSEADTLTRNPESRAWTARALEFDVRFHDVLAAAAGNERLRREISKYRCLVRAFCRMSGNRDNLRQALAEHRRILDALEARDATAARRAMAAHVDARLKAVLQALEPPQ
jgi:DNA-binding GntR family transcriptional regulator